MSLVPAQRAAWIVVLAGGVAALQVGKLPPALPALQAELGLTLVQSGFLLSMVQLAGMSLAVFMGLWADGMGLRRSMVRGLCLLALASGLGAFATSVTALLALRAIEGLGFLLVALPAPALIRRLVPVAQLPGMLGVWGAYMPTGTALALLAGPLFIPAWGWNAWWGLFAMVSLAMAAALLRAVPADPVAAQPRQSHGAVGSWQRLRSTLGARGPWLVALTFGMYSGQWLAVVGFLPSIYAAAGVSGALLGVLTALAAAVNIAGNMASGRLLQRGWAPRTTLWLGGGASVAGALLALLAPQVVSLLLGSGYDAAVPVLRLLALLLPIIAVGTVLGIFWALPLGRDRALLVITAAAGVLNVLLVLALVPRHGASGMAGAVVVAELLVSASLAVMYARWRPLPPAVA